MDKNNTVWNGKLYLPPHDAQSLLSDQEIFGQKSLSVDGDVISGELQLPVVCDVTSCYNHATNDHGDYCSKYKFCTDPLQDTSSEDEYEIPVAPDGGYGWVIVCACFVLQMVVPGLISVFGVFLPQFLDYFDSLRGKTAITGSMLSACTMIPGPFVSVLVSLIGCRAVAMLGGLFITAGLLLATLANSVEMLIVTMGLISGIGLGLIYLPLVVMVGFWFDKKRAIAMGITTSGAGIGVMFMGSLSGWLLQHFDWRNALVLVSGFTLQCVVCGTLLRPVVSAPNYRKKRSETPHGVEDNSDKPSNKDALFNKNIAIQQNQKLNNSVHSLDIGGKNRRLQTDVPSKYFNHSSLVVNKSHVFHQQPYHSYQDVSKHGLSVSTKNVHLDRMLVVNQLMKEDVFYSGSTSSLQNYIDSKHNIAHLKNEVKLVGHKPADPFLNVSVHHSVEIPHDSRINTNISDGLCYKSKYISPMKKMLGIHILSSVPFLIILLANSLFQTGFVICICFVTDYGLSIGLSSEAAAHMNSAFGIGTTLGRIAGGAVTSLPKIGPVQATSVSLGLAGCCSFCIVFCNGFISLAIFVGLTGFFLAPIIPLTAVMQVEYLGLENLTNAHGMVSLGKGIVSLFGPPLAGVLQDWTGSATPAFYLTGAILILAAVLQATLLVCPHKQSL